VKKCICWCLSIIELKNARWNIKKSWHYYRGYTGLTQHDIMIVLYFVCLFLYFCLFSLLSFCAYIPTACQMPVQEVSCILIKKEYVSVAVCLTFLLKCGTVPSNNPWSLLYNSPAAHHNSRLFSHLRVIWWWIIVFNTPPSSNVQSMCTLIRIMGIEHGITVRTI